MKVKKEFLKKVVKYKSLDTKTYRYKSTRYRNENEQLLVISRIELEKLETTEALKIWETVAITWDGETFEYRK